MICTAKACHWFDPLLVGFISFICSPDALHQMCPALYDNSCTDNERNEAARIHTSSRDGFQQSKLEQSLSNDAINLASNHLLLSPNG